MRKISVDIRYCGGCNPDYDRTGLVEEIKHALNDRCSFDEGPGPADWILIINGCLTACAGMEHLPPDRCVILRRPTDAFLFIEGIRAGDESRFETLRCCSD